MGVAELKYAFLSWWSHHVYISQIDRKYWDDLQVNADHFKLCHFPPSSTTFLQTLPRPPGRYGPLLTHSLDWDFHTFSITFSTRCKASLPHGLRLPLGTSQRLDETLHTQHSQCKSFFLIKLSITFSMNQWNQLIIKSINQQWSFTIHNEQMCWKITQIINLTIKAHYCQLTTTGQSIAHLMGRAS